MRSITFQPAGAAVQVLANGTKAMMCVEYEVTPSRIVQEVPRPRAKTIDVYDRKNYSTAIRFVVRRDFSTVQAAFQFLHTHAALVGGRGAFRSALRTASSIGANFVLEVTGYREEGKALYVAYLARGGVMT